MSRWTFIFRSLRFYWRTHLGVIGGVALATAILVGALAVGDSVRASLRRLAAERVGSVQVAMSAGERFFRDALADELSQAMPARTAAAITLSAVASTPDGTARANDVQLLGVDDRFWQFAPTPSSKKLNPGCFSMDDESILLNDRLAAQLNAHIGDYVVVRGQKPSLLPRDAPLSSDAEEDTCFAATLKVSAIVTADDFSHFNLVSDQIPPMTAFVSRALLARKIGQAGKANLLLAGGGAGLSQAQAEAALKALWQLADAEMGVIDLATPAAGAELKTARVFLEPAVASAAAQADESAMGVLTYFVNEIRAGSRATPYSMTTAIGPLSASNQPLPAPLPGQIADGEIIINQWLADDLGLSQPSLGQEIELEYYILGSDRQVLTRKHPFKLAGIVPLQGLAADEQLMPAFPGLADSANCRDWKPGIPIDLKKIRPEDEQYWRNHRGTPKAFISLKAGRQLWGNRFGDLTAVRYPTGHTPAQIASAIRSHLTPSQVGLQMLDIGHQAEVDGSPAMDLGQLFLGLSLFLIVSAVLLMGLMFVLNLQQRMGEVGILLAVGLTSRGTRRLLLLEALVLSAVGSAIGTPLGAAYTWGMLSALASLWPAAVGGMKISLHIEPLTLLVGGLSGLAISAGVMWLGLRRMGKLAPNDLLAGHVVVSASRRQGLSPARGNQHEQTATTTRTCRQDACTTIPAIACLAFAIGIIASAGGGQAAIGAFFVAGALLLVALILICRAMLGRSAKGLAGGIGALAMRNAGRRRSRSMATIAMLACGCFIVIAVGASRHNPAACLEQPSSPSGGFGLLAKSAMPIYRDLDDPGARDQYGLSAEVMADVRIAAMHVRSGASADCLNLNQPSQPQLLGISSNQFMRRGAFEFVGEQGNWAMLDDPLGDGIVPAVGDENTIRWSLRKTIGDCLDYIDEFGRPIKVKLVGMLANCVLQGNLVISDANFRKHFPSQAGYRYFLIDCPAEKQAEVSRELSRQLSDIGMEVMPTSRRLAELSAVENAYMSIFQLLGGLGLLLGSAGLAMVVMRNVLERRGELALLRAVGFSRQRIARLILREHWLLLALGVLCGTLSAGLAVLPALRHNPSQIPLTSLGVTILAALASGLLWVYLAARLALRGELLPSLRRE